MMEKFDKNREYVKETISQGIDDYKDEENEKYGPDFVIERLNKIQSYERRLINKLNELAPNGQYNQEMIKKATLEMDKENVTFYVAEYGLETSLDAVMSSDEWADSDPKDFKPNRHWRSVTVKNEADKNKWIELKNSSLHCAFAPNQDSEERSRNIDRMRQLEQEMSSLEV